MIEIVMCSVLKAIITTAPFLNQGLTVLDMTKAIQFKGYQMWSYNAFENCNIINITLMKKIIISQVI